MFNLFVFFVIVSLVSGIVTDMARNCEGRYTRSFVSSFLTLCIMAATYSFFTHQGMICFPRSLDESIRYTTNILPAVEKHGVITLQDVNGKVVSVELLAQMKPHTNSTYLLIGIR